MKRILLTTLSFAVLAALAAPAGAADLPRRYDQPIVPKAPIYSPAYNWTGFYLGINGGGGWGRSEWDTTGDFSVSGGLIGGTAGYNWQTGAFVFGLEGDLDWSGISGNTNTFCGFGCKTSNSWLSTVRGRAGYAFDRIMPYVTGGIALGGIGARTPGFAGRSETNSGWTVGGGLEVALMNNFTAKVEYLYVDLGEVNCGLACGPVVPNDVTFTSHILRGGINYRF